jgi:hypothetical protein
MKALIIAFLTPLLLGLTSLRAQTVLVYGGGAEQVEYGIGRLRNALVRSGQTLHVTSDLKSKSPDIWVISDKNVPKPLMRFISKKDIDSLSEEGYELRWINGKKTLLIIANEPVGAMYGLLQVTDNMVASGTIDNIQPKIHHSDFEYRILKFNLPWSPYRKSEATEVHMETCRDLRFWERYLDMMVENRFNALSLWNNHPFPYMIKSAGFPKATPFTDSEMDEWRTFWKKLFRMARQRGIQTFVINWNIVVSPEFAKAYGAKEYSDMSDQVKTYTRESVTQLIDEYEDLTGIGVTLADWMGNFPDKMTPQQREDWIEDTFVAGMKAAKRPVKFIHRSVLAGDPIAMRNLIDRAGLKEPALVEIKFNWSHGHSTPKLAISHDYHSGKLDERFWTPKPENYKIQWMVRNEDFFILRWGQPDFIREHLKLNSKDYVNGYFIGAEGYIPAMDYSHKISSVKTWEYAFEKQWLFFKVWGKLLYDRTTPDKDFENVFDQKYGGGVGEDLLAAYKLASQMPLRLASFYRSTWDYTLYSEGFIEAEPASGSKDFDRSNPLISISDLINHETLDPAMLSIKDYVNLVINKQAINSDRITPLALADSSEEDSKEALGKITSLRNKVSPFSGALASELDDAATWSHLGLYFADKLRAGVALQTYYKTGVESQKEKAVSLLEKCNVHWQQVVLLTKDRYLPVPHVATQNYGPEFSTFSWEALYPQVLNDVKIASEANYRP